MIAATLPDAFQASQLYIYSINLWQDRASICYMLSSNHLLLLFKAITNKIRRSDARFVKLWLVAFRGLLRWKWHNFSLALNRYEYFGAIFLIIVVAHTGCACSWVLFISFWRCFMWIEADTNAPTDCSKALFAWPCHHCLGQLLHFAHIHVGTRLHIRKCIQVTTGLTNWTCLF